MDLGHEAVTRQGVATERSNMPQSVVFDHRKVLPKIDMVTLERCCKAFHEEFKTRRSNCDDGAWALRLLAEIQRRGCPTLRTARQLVGSRYGQNGWCHTGHSYTKGIDLAQKICRLD